MPKNLNLFIVNFDCDNLHESVFTMFVSAECLWQCHTFADFKPMLPVKDSGGIEF